MDQQHRIHSRWLVRLLILVIVLALPVVVFADTVRNDVAAGAGNPTEFELGNLKTVNYYIKATQGSGDLPGCNPTTVSPALVTINTPAAVTASPRSLTFTACGVNQPVVFTASAAGSYSITASATGPGSYSTSSANFTLKVLDTTPPTIDITAPANDGTYLLNEVVNADYECTDLSTVTTCAGPVPNGATIDTTTVGSKSFTVAAVDASGNNSSLTHTYSVAYNFAGFFQPIDNSPIVNVAKAGSAIPVKFSLSGDYGLDILAGSPLSQPVACESGMQEDQVLVTIAASASSLTYDAGEDQYNYVWKTDKAWSGTCRQLSVALIDGTTHIAIFRFNK